MLSLLPSLSGPSQRTNPIWRMPLVRLCNDKVAYKACHAQEVTVTQPPSPSTSTGRRLTQAATSDSDNITANLGVSTNQNVQVNITVSVPYQDSNNASAIAQAAITSGQIRRGLQEAGLSPCTSPHHPVILMPTLPQHCCALHSPAADVLPELAVVQQDNLVASFSLYRSVQ